MGEEVARYVGGEQERRIEGWVAAVAKRWETIPYFLVDAEKLRHLAIICDGDRRSAVKKDLPAWAGHKLGVEVIKGVLRAGREWNIHTLTFWVWSTENWKRDREQVSYIMSLAGENLADDELLRELCKNEARFSHLGRKDRLDPGIRERIYKWETKTACFDRYRVNMALDYGGFDEVVRMVARVTAEMKAGRLTPEGIVSNPGLIWGFLDTVGQFLPDLVVRTGVGPDELPHTSCFLPLQTGYAAWLFKEEDFPDLEPMGLLDSIRTFLEYRRRFGG